jgi:triosephosphate isomerase
MLKIPTIVVNVKTYQEAIGNKALEIAKQMERVAKERAASLAIAVQPMDLRMIAEVVEIPVYAQHLDPIKPGSHTGWILPESMKDAGARGTLINHSEHRLILAEIDECIRRAKACGLETIVCTNNVPTSVAASGLNPDFVAIEPPELIGGEVSVTTANPEIVMRAVKAVRQVNNKVNILCGAGVKGGKDVAKAIELGTQGVLLASGVVKAKDKAWVLAQLAQGLIKS